VSLHLATRAVRLLARLGLPLALPAGAVSAQAANGCSALQALFRPGQLKRCTSHER
jgi:hypothetical protein